MTAEDFVSHVAGHAGVPIGEADTATRVVLSAIGGYLTSERREQIAEELPPALRRALLAPVDAAVPVEERLLTPGENAAIARELVASVCHVLAEKLSNEALEWLGLALPSELARLLARPAHDASYDEHLAGMRDTLASGKPGSHHPVGDTPIDRGQSGSVASANPHGATKLSSSPGTTQDRRHDTLAEAHGDASRALATAKP